MKIVVIGSSGMLGSYFKYVCADAIGISRTNGKYTDFLVQDYLFELDTILDGLNCDIIVNCAAITDLRKCEEIKSEAQNAHVCLTSLLSKRRERVVHVSTDSVFDGTNCPSKGYTELCKPNPLNYYAKSKLEGEAAILKAGGIVIRTNIFGLNIEYAGNSLFEWGVKQCLKNQTILGFTDIMFNPVSIQQLTNAILFLVRRQDVSGLINICSTDRLSKFDFLQKIYAGYERDIKLVKRSISENKNSILRPKCTVLNPEKATSIGIPKFELDAGLKQMIALERQANGRD